MTATSPDTDKVEFSRLHWRCRRGMRELDAVLLAFLDQSFAALDREERRRFAAILDLPDPELYAYLVRRVEPEDPHYASLFERIRQSVRPPS